MNPIHPGTLLSRTLSRILSPYISYFLVVSLREATAMGRLHQIRSCESTMHVRHQTLESCILVTHLARFPRIILIWWLHAIYPTILVLEFACSNMADPRQYSFKTARTSFFAARRAKKLLLPFFQLPLEVRRPIYFLVIRPDCLRSCDKDHEHQNGSEHCLDLLVTCSQTYVEAVEILHSQRRTFTIETGGLDLFRAPRDHPKPHYFFSSVRTSRCYTPPTTSELEFVRFRKLELLIEFEPLVRNRGNDGKHDRKLALRIAILTKVVPKMTDIKSIRLCLRNYTQPGHGNVTDRERAITKLLEAMVQKRIEIRGRLCPAQPYKYLEYDKAAANGIWITAGRLASRIKFLLVVAEIESLIAVSPSTTVQLGDLSLAPADEAGESTTLDSHSIHDNLDTGPCREVSYGPQTIVGITTADLREYEKSELAGRDYAMVPECRMCLTIFATNTELKVHLIRNRSHQTNYVYRQPNPIHRFARGPAGRKCWTCGRGYESIATLNDHLDRMHHRRHGIIPRYLEDNIGYDLSWVRWKTQKGWL